MKNEHATESKSVPTSVAAASEPSAASPRKKSAARKPQQPAPKARAGTKTAAILALLRRPKGATMNELIKATGWQAHSVRGFISGAVGSKMGLKVNVLDRNGERAYHVKS